MLQTVRFAPATRLAPSASSTPSVTQAKNVQRQGLSPGYLDVSTRRFLAIKESGTTPFALLLTRAQVAEYYASVLREIDSPKSVKAISTFQKMFRGFSERRSYVEGIPTSQEVATPLAEKFSALAADMQAYIESLIPKA